MLHKLPNLLTLSRVALLPVLIGLFFIEGAVAAWTALAIYIFCALTDFFDGYLARRYGHTSRFGAFLDPISDKIMVSSLMLTLATFERLHHWWIVPAIIILMREFLISGLREYLSRLDVNLPTTRLAKWKTGFQMTALGFLTIGDYGDVLVPHTLLIGQILLTIAAVITVITGWGYLKMGYKHI